MKDTETEINNNYICTQNTAFNIRKYKSQTKKPNWKLVLEPIYAVAPEIALLWNKSGLKDIAFTTRQEATDALTLFLKTYNLSI